MRIASFNVENMFRRPVVLNQRGWSEGAGDVLEAYSSLGRLLEKPTYSTADKDRILELLGKLGLTGSDESEWAFLRRPRGQLVIRHKDGTVEVTAGGRGEWIGWLELKREAVDETATRNTAAVIADMEADVLAVIEAEDRTALQRFDTDVLKVAFSDRSKAWSYRHVMLIDGNDDRGIDVGLLTRDDYPIGQMRSHVDDRDAQGHQIFSRDCAEFELATPSGEPLLMMVNHFKSKGYGKQSDNDAIRTRQSQRVAEIYEHRRKDGWDRVVVAGDLNDVAANPPLKPLTEDTDLKDASAHPSFEFGERKGTYGGGNESEKIDYLLLSPLLLEAVNAGGINRKGVWHGPRVKNPWEMLPTLTRETEAASDHAAIWVDLAL